MTASLGESLGDEETPSWRVLEASGDAAALDQPARRRPLLARVANDVAMVWEFARTAARDFSTTASIVPSSRFLVDSMLAEVPLAQAKCVVEIGPGIGTVTEALLQRLPRGAHLHAIELSEPLLQTMCRRLPDPRLRPIHGDAAHARALVRADGCAGEADAVFSSLGLSMMPPALRDEIVRGMTETLRPGGTLVQYAYLHAWLGFWTPRLGFTRFDGRRFFRERFHEVHTRLVVANVPPAAVHTCRTPRAAPVRALPAGPTEG